MSSLLPCPVACQPLPVRVNALRAGVSVLKLNKWKLPQSRFLWLDIDSQELRWSKNSRQAAISYKRLPFSRIQKVSKLSKYRHMRAEHGFTLDTAERTYVFRTETVEMRDKLVAGVAEWTRKEDRWSIRSLPCNLEPAFEDTENCITPERKGGDQFPTAIGNQSDALVCSREIFSKTGSAHRKARRPDEVFRNILTQISLAVAPKPNPNISQSPYFDDLPDTITRVIESQDMHIHQLQEDLEHEQQESTKTQVLRKRLRMLDACKEELEALETQNEDLKSALTAQMEASLKLEEQISALLPDSERNDDDFPDGDSEEMLIRANFDLLRKGFQGYVCCFSDEVVAKQICLSPKKLGEEPSYKKRFVLCSPDLAQLIWKPISLFSNRRVFICMSEISSVLSGTETPEMQPFPDYAYLTVLSPQITLILAVEFQYSFFLEGIKALFAKSNGFPFTLSSQDSDLLLKYKAASQHYEALLKQLDRQSKRYKATLTDSISNVVSLPVKTHAVYQEEIEALRSLNEKCVSSLLSPEADYYLQAEKAELESRLRVLSSLLQGLD